MSNTQSTALDCIFLGEYQNSKIMSASRQGQKDLSNNYQPRFSRGWSAYQSPTFTVTRPVPFLPTPVPENSRIVFSAATAIQSPVLTRPKPHLEVLIHPRKNYAVTSAVTSTAPMLFNHPYTFRR